MAHLREAFSRQILLSGERPGSLRWLLEDMECLFEDEVVIHGSIQEQPVPPFACEFTHDGLYGNLMAVADEDGCVQLLDTRKPLDKARISEIFCHHSAIFDISWLPGGTKMLTASGDVTVCLWDVTCGAAIGKFNFHKGSVKCVDSNKNDPFMFVSGGREGNICVWDTRCSAKKNGQRPANFIPEAHKPLDRMTKITKKTKRGEVQQSTNYSVTSVLFHGTDKVVSVGSVDGVKMWDLRKNYSSCKVSPPRAYLLYDPVTSVTGKRCGFTSLVADSHHGYLFGTCTNNIIYKYSLAGSITKPVEHFSGCDISSFFVKSCLSPDDKFLLSGSSCGNGFIWEVDSKAPPLVLSTASKEITAVSWCPTALDKLATCSDDNSLRLWRVKRGRRGGDKGDSVIGSCKEYQGQGIASVKRFRAMN